WSTGAALTNGMWLEVDMQTAKSFNALTMDSAGSTTDYARGYTVAVSNDGATFNNVASGTGSAALINASFAQQSARYIKITQTGAATSWWSIAELNVYSGSGGGTAGSGGGTAGASGTAGAGGGTATRINCGGPAVSPFVADVDFAGGGTLSHANTIDVSGVTNPAPMAVYQTARDGTFTYTIPGFTAGSSHTVRLHMAETYWSAAGARLFNVSINGTQVLSSFDIFATAGAKNKAIVEQFSAPANGGGQYVIQATSVKDNSLISGIEIQ
ncbi:MAG TPA: malectin domain-containing carbohydrate-binding protein, partial [Polyangia bacterium]|nr:malectin domain-containing carbohydrate-binding protein [Polyangia bacterium]